MSSSGLAVQAVGGVWWHLVSSEQVEPQECGREDSSGKAKCAAALELCSSRWRRVPMGCGASLALSPLSGPCPSEVAECWQQPGCGLLLKARHVPS